MFDLDQFVIDHLNLQVKLSFEDHCQFLVENGLLNCKEVLDIGVGNGTFTKNLAMAQSQIQFVGIDKRMKLVDQCNSLNIKNLKAIKFDIFSNRSDFDLTRFDGFLMRYFLLHIDNSSKIFTQLKENAKSMSKIWIIDLDWSSVKCSLDHPGFNLMFNLVKEFCFKISKESNGANKGKELLRNAGYSEIVEMKKNFYTDSQNLNEFVQYLKQEMICYSLMLGRGEKNEELDLIFHFLNEEILSEKAKLEYGMIFLSASIN